MIEFLKISSMAIFDEAEIEFRKGLNCITGETGAGKSLVLGALTLLMGSKASQDMVRPDAQKAVIEALFTVGGRQSVIRREIYPTGSSRCYIDGKLATANSLAEFSSGLITIYGQHEYQDLLNPVQQMSILEDLAGLERDGVQEAFDCLADAVRTLKDLEDRIEAGRQEKDDLLFALNELRSMEISPGMEEELASELSLARGAAELKQCAQTAEEILYSGSSSVIELAAQAKDCIGRVASKDPRADKLLESMNDIIVQVEDVSMALREKAGAYEYDPSMIEILEGKLHFLQDLKKKHRTDEGGLIALREDLQARLSLAENSDTMIRQMQEAVTAAVKAYKGLVRNFLKKRHEFARDFCTKINCDLEALGMPGTEFKVQQAGIKEIDESFSDSRGMVLPPGAILKGEFLISTNVGQKALPLARIASGGELSRIMLAIKVRQETSQEGTLIFDEVDAGISGQTAFMIAQRLKELSGHVQSIVVTHLHQVASVADTHFVISKDSSDGVTSSSIQEVTRMDRVLELARMMGGESPSQAVIEHAKELVGL